ncbi:hypothetical protein ETU09_05940 [Apibacter muscae]|uniref:Uncharacterized protein n=1 Tax=Apibacter muscae TaxID=2509004 RepID=A0A563DFB9_9FLAO|nr:hypothetical protein [Apibacter muscae]TWP28464.1 hypothetical protein ETU09_05940 [Apibacter muscae]
MFNRNYNAITLMVLFAMLLNSCQKTEIQRIADEYYNGNVDSMYSHSLKIKNQQTKFKTDSIKYLNMVEYVFTENVKCNSFRDIYALKIDVKDTTGLDLKGLSNFLLRLERPYNIDNNCNYSFYKDIIIYKNINEAKKSKDNWIIINSPSLGFSTSL